MDAIDEFFAAYADFDYDRSASSPREFCRMCDHFGWSKDGAGDYPSERVAAHREFKMAMVQAFNHNFGTDVDDKHSWENICEVLGVDPLPTRMKDMKEVSCLMQIFETSPDPWQLVKSTHVNLSDLLDSSRSGGTVRIFDTEAELATYTLHEGRIFPKDEAYAGGVLRYLLREITGTYKGRKGSDRRRPRSRR